eukprot:3439513-Pleurochrysis_carterae.AAC.2
MHYLFLLADHHPHTKDLSVLGNILTLNGNDRASMHHIRQGRLAGLCFEQGHLMKMDFGMVHGALCPYSRSRQADHPCKKADHPTSNHLLKQVLILDTLMHIPYPISCLNTLQGASQPVAAEGAWRSACPQQLVPSCVPSLSSECIDRSRRQMLVAV